ncbi:MAG: HlyC/CorC family transporter [Rhodospirillaceae bacterium]|nr:HlyC/CorC family transporter [Rhodospirillaceae bacterium]
MNDPGFINWAKGLLGLGNGEGSARDVLEELIDERDDAEMPIDDEERLLLANILELRGRTIYDVMVPRADIIALESNAGLSDVIAMITAEGHSRLPVYRETLDDAIGMIHIKDVLAWRGRDKEFSLSDIVRRVLFVPPSMQVLELLLEMRAKRSHMALVVDEYGGVDGLVTIEDLVEEIVGEIEDEHDRTDIPQMIECPDGSLDADARVTIEALEKRIGTSIGGEEDEDIDTLGGIVFALAGRVPVRGELIGHPSGLEFEILEADPRRIRRLRLRHLDALNTPIKLPAGGA